MQVEESSASILADYQITELLSEGANASVYRGEDRRSLTPVAIKVIDKSLLDPKELLYIRNEVKILENVDHPNIVKMLEWSETAAELYIVLELMHGGELFERICTRGIFSEREAGAVLRTLLDAVRYCHARGIVHRDLKPENILYATSDETSIIKISDFGVSRVLAHPHQMLSTIVGSSTY